MPLGAACVGCVRALARTREPGTPLTALEAEREAEREAAATAAAPR